MLLLHVEGVYNLIIRFYVTLGNLPRITMENHIKLVILTEKGYS